MSVLPENMSGVVLTGHGDFDKLQYQTDIPMPSLGKGQVLVKVGAAGVNNTDINTRIGWYSKADAAEDDAGWTGEALSFPRIQGADVCGEIVAVGTGLDNARIGDRVLIEPCIRELNGEVLAEPWYIGSEFDGGFAQYTTIPAIHAHRINSSLTDIELASFPCSYSTAENLLTKSRVKEGETVLVTGASGGAGSAAVQLAKARGAKVIAVTSPSKSKSVLALGASSTLSREESVLSTLGKNCIDVVIDLVAGSQFTELLEVLKPGGRYAVSGAIGGPIVELDVRTLYLKDLSFFGCTVLEPEVFSNLVRLIESNAIKPVVAASFPLEKIVDAQKLFLEKKHTGKIVLSVNAKQ